MAKHTPGPWKVEGSIYDHMHSEIASVMPGSERGIAQVWKHDNAMVDARLIAAAPDMLEALEKEQDLRTQAQNYLARFHDGEFGIQALEHHLTGVFTGNHAAHCAELSRAAITKATA